MRSRKSIRRGTRKGTDTQEPRRSVTWPKVSRVLHLLLVLAPLAYLIKLIADFHDEVPVLDQWDFIPLLRKSYEGTVTLHDLWAQHNEHRIIFPRLLMLALAHVSGWQVTWEMAASVVLAVLMFLAIVRQVRTTSRLTHKQGLMWTIPMISLAIFSANQEQNWLWGWQVQMLMNMLVAVVGLLLLANPGLTFWRYSGALALGIVALYSFANGAVYWVIGAVVLLAVRGEATRKTAYSRLAVWLVAGALAMYSYLYDFKPVAEHPKLSFVFENPLAWLRYILAYVGTPCLPSRAVLAPIAVWVGGAGLLLLISTTWLAVRSKQVTLQLLLPYLSLCGYAIGGAMITAIGRAGFGVAQAMASRYVTMANPIWITNLVLLTVLVSSPFRGERNDKQTAKMTGWRLVACLAIVAIISLIAYSSIDGRTLGRYRHEFLSPVVDELALGDAYDNPEYHYAMLEAIHPKPDVVMERISFLREFRLSLYRK